MGPEIEETGRALKRKEKCRDPLEVMRRRESIWKRARDLNTVCGAQVAVIMIPPDGKIFEAAITNDMTKLLARFSNCVKLPALKTSSEVTKEIDGDTRQEPKLKKQKLMGIDFSCMTSDELYEVEQRLNKGLMHIKDRKMQILKEQVEKSEMQERQALQKRDDLLRKVAELHGSLTKSTSDPVSLFPRSPDAGGNKIPPADKDSLPPPFTVKFEDVTATHVKALLIPSTSNLRPLKVQLHRFEDNLIRFGDEEYSVPPTSSLDRPTSHIGAETEGHAKPKYIGTTSNPLLPAVHLGSINRPGNGKLLPSTRSSLGNIILPADKGSLPSTSSTLPFTIKFEDVTATHVKAILIPSTSNRRPLKVQLHQLEDNLIRFGDEEFSLP